MKNLPSIPMALCKPDDCPLADKCPIGPTPNLPCEYREKFLAELNHNIARSFKDIDASPEVSIRVNLMLRPLFEQLLQLRLSELANPDPLFGTKANPLMKEIRQVILAIDKVMQETVRLYHQGPVNNGSGKSNRQGNPLGMADRGYYEMLVIDDQASVEERKGMMD